MTLSAGSAEGGAIPVDRVVTMRCTIPEGLVPGQQLTWQSPSGKLVAMTVPAGCEAGQVLEFHVPASLVHGHVEGCRPLLRPFGSDG